MSVHVYDLSLDQLTARLTAWGEPAFRAKQVYAQLWKRGATYEEMTDVAPACANGWPPSCRSRSKC